MKITVEKPEGKTPVRRHKCRWENIEMNYKEIWWGLI
jgi:hypothetical protein